MPTPSSGANAAHSTDLAGIHILVTRPAEQAGPLCQAIEAAGGVAVHYPTIEIAAIPVTVDFDPGRADIGIFISRNAVRYALQSFPQLLHSQLKTITVGRGSAEEYQKISGRAIDYTPHQHFNSEGVLELPELAAVAGRQIILFKGEGGRETLEQELSNRGAQVIPLELYRRAIPHNSAPLKWQEIDIILITSNMALEHLWQMTPESERPLLLEKPLIVISDRGEKLAQELGFHYHPLQASSAENSALLDTLFKWQRDSPDSHAGNSKNHSRGDPH
jgi:uroporphyrinogen-III synthase